MNALLRLKCLDPQNPNTPIVHDIPIGKAFHFVIRDGISPGSPFEGYFEPDKVHMYGVFIEKDGHPFELEICRDLISVEFILNKGITHAI